ncbi:MAG: hypothetical protein RLZZ153_1254 [Pseudomonadota bacterium]|jgi:hypothetical protein
MRWGQRVNCEAYRDLDLLSRRSKAIRQASQSDLQNTPTQIVIESYSAGASLIDKNCHESPHKRQYMIDM